MVGRSGRALHSAVDRGLDFLVAHPEIARERVELSPPMRIHRIAAHLIYRIEPDYLDIIRIRHGREDWMSDPFGE